MEPAIEDYRTEGPQIARRSAFKHFFKGWKFVFTFKELLILSGEDPGSQDMRLNLKFEVIWCVIGWLLALIDGFLTGSPCLWLPEDSVFRLWMQMMFVLEVVGDIIHISFCSDAKWNLLWKITELKARN